MKNLHVLLALVVSIAFCIPSYADKASSAFERGARAEAQNDYDKAYEGYEEAYRLKNQNAKYFAAYTRIKFHAASEHVRAGQLLRDSGKLQEALAEFQKASEIDRTSFIAQQELRRTSDMLRKQERHEEGATVRPQSPLTAQAESAQGPVELQAISSTRINLHMTATADKVYKVLGKLAGVNVLIDPEFHAQPISIELNDVTPREALNMVAMQSKSFWQAASVNTIFISPDTPAKRKELQGNVMKTFYLKNVSSPTELQEAANTVKGILDISRIQLIPTQSAIIMRGSAAQMVLAEKLFSDIDKPRAEVVIDITVMQVSRTRTRTLGTVPPTSANVVLVPGTGGASSSGSGGTFTFNSLRNLTANNVQVTIPGASVTALMSDSNTKILQNPEVRALDNEKATLKIGDRVPIATGSFAGTSTGSALVNTQFQYLDVGVNIDITPHVHSPDEVTLKMVLEISSVTGQQTIGGITQPIIGQRRIEHETRLKDGDVNLVGGILEDSETQSLSGYPWLTKIPILKYLFGQDAKDLRENEIVFAITPHIIRAQDVTEQNLKLVDVGTGSSVDIRQKEPPPPDASAARGGSRSPQGNAAQPKEPKAPKVSATPSTNTPPTKTKEAPPVVEPPQKLLVSFTTPVDDMELPARAAPPPPKPYPPKQGANDPCPYGQHLIAYENSAAVCAFD